jgi:CRP/FNR family transcriptional regulator, cyclic AMP receptor protein
MPSTMTDARIGAIDKAAILRDQPLFRDLAPASLDELCRYARPVRFSREEAVFLKGDPGSSLFVVVDGAVRASSVSAEGRTAMLNLISQGEIFGEIAVLDGQPRTTDAIANTDCLLLAIDRRDLLGFLARQPELAMKFITLLCARIRWTSEQVEQVMLQTMPTRLAKIIVRLAERRDRAETAKIEMTQQQISEMAGMSRESVNKLLAVWAAEGWVRLGPGILHVVRIDALRAMSGDG